MLIVKTKAKKVEIIFVTQAIRTRFLNVNDLKKIIKKLPNMTDVSSL